MQNRASGRLSIELEQHAIRATLLAPRTERILWDKTWAVNDCMDMQCYPQVARELDQLLGSTAPEISVILPDPMVKYVSFEVDSLPEKSVDTEALIKWRVREEFFLDTQHYQLDYTVYPGETQTISVFAIEQQWMQQLNEIFFAYGLLLSSYITSSLQGIASLQNDDWQGFMINIGKEFITYGLFDDEQMPLMLESQALDSGDREGCSRFLQRAGRAFAATTLHLATGPEKQILKLGNDQLDDLLNEIFHDYRLQAAR